MCLKRKSALYPNTFRFCFVTTPYDTQELLLALSLGITAGNLGTIWDAEIKPRLAKCKALPAVLSLQHQNQIPLKQT